MDRREDGANLKLGMNEKGDHDVGKPYSLYCWYPETMGHGATSNKESCGNDEKDKRIQELEKQLQHLEAENRRLREGNGAKKFVVSSVAAAAAAPATATPPAADSTASFTVPNQVAETAIDSSSVQSLPESGLTPDQVERYSRQLILSRGLGGVEGQRRLLSSRVLVVGAGGIGSTCLLYLASSGIGHIGIVDFDIVEISNLHRQVIHSTDRCGWNKAVSACYTLDRLNPTIQCRAYPLELDQGNVMELVQQYDCVVDCSDNPKTRYLINDACVLANKPLVSGSSVGVEGQLTVYNHDDGPCYRCLYPQPSSTSQGCRACSDAGVFGPVPGLIGILQATETIKIITNSGNTMNNRLLMYDALQSTFCTIKKPPKTTQSSNCPVCGPEPTICSMKDSCESLSMVTGPRRKPTPPPIDDELNMTCQEYNHIRQQGVPHILLDVRVKEQFDLCHLDGAIHIPLDDLPKELHRVESLSEGGTKPIYCICRRGINSIAATKMLHEHIIETAITKSKTTNDSSSKNNGNWIHSVRNIAGGLTAWQKEVDPAFPKY